jgi:hypothetical protein
MSWRF